MTRLFPFNLALATTYASAITTLPLQFMQYTMQSPLGYSIYVLVTAVLTLFIGIPLARLTFLILYTLTNWDIFRPYYEHQH